jgi:hypothetical protein
MAVPALGGALVAYAIVPLTAGSGGPAIWSSDLFLFTRATVVPCAVILEVPGFEMTESAKLRELDMLNLSCVSADGLIEVDHFGVREGKGSEKLKNVFRVLLELERTVWESTEDGSSGGIPCDGPISMGLHKF